MHEGHRQQQVGHRLQFDCTGCQKPILFSVLNTQDIDHPVSCPHCQKKYRFDEAISRQLKQFEALCRQIQSSEEILGNTALAINVGPHHVEFPYKLLLTRLNSLLKLKIEGKVVEVAFRIEPTRDFKGDETPS